MANAEHLAALRKGAEYWSQWKEETGLRKPDLSDALLPDSLSGVDLRGADLRRANLCGADLGGAYLSGANLADASLRAANLHGSYLGRANLRRAFLRQADLREADLGCTNLKGADLSSANLSEANLGGADLRGANLSQATLVWTNLQRANLAGCRVYGISAWDVDTDGSIQSNLIITPDTQSDITVDNLEVAQFIYLLLRNGKIRHVIDTITSKVVLILGRFTVERKGVLDAIRDALRRKDYLPVLFDFTKPDSRDITETVSTLAHLARFVIADITDAKSIPQELQRIVPNLPSVPIQPLLLSSQQEYGMFEHFRRYPWVLVPVLYDSQSELLDELEARVIAPAESMILEDNRHRTKKG